MIPNVQSIQSKWGGGFFLIPLVTLLVLAGTAGASARSDSGSMEVRVRVLEPIQIEGIAALDFGNLLSEGSGNSETVYRLAPDGTLSVTGEGNAAHAGGEENGRFTLSGTEGQGFSYEARITRDFSDSALALEAVHAGEVGSSAGSGSFGSNETEILLGGDLKMTGSPSPGDHSDAEVTLTVSYD